MIDDNSLMQLVRDAESDRVERKAEFGDKDKILRTLCAFANDLPNHQMPGVLIIGVTDDGAFSGALVDDKLLKDLANLREELLPFPAIDIKKRTIDDHDLAVVEVSPSSTPPVRYRGTAYVRVGPTTRSASAEDERRLSEKQRFSNVSPDIRPMPLASLEDLDERYFTGVYLPLAVSMETLGENRRIYPDQLASVRFATGKGNPTPTLLGILAVGKGPRRWFPGAYVQFLRIDGTALDAPIKDQQDIDGPLVELLRRLDDVLKANIQSSMDNTSGPTHRIRPDYPLAALQQMTRNAILHRSYEGTNAPVHITWFNDRIEIQNPGGPFGQVTLRNFGQSGVTDYRNPHLAEVMKNTGFVEKFGVGIPLARKHLEDNGNPPLELHPDESHVLVTIRKSS